MSDWPQIKARLEGCANEWDKPCPECGAVAADIRATLQRVEELEEMYTSLGRNYDMLEKRAEGLRAEHLKAVEVLEEADREARRARAEVKRLEELIVTWADIGPSRTRDSLRAEAKRIRGKKQ